MSSPPSRQVRVNLIREPNTVEHGTLPARHQVQETSR